MTAPSHVLDNRDRKVVDYLRKHLANAEAFSIVSAYFTIYGYGELADELDRIPRTRFLFGDPSSVDDLDPGEKQAKSYSLTDKGLVPNHALAQKFLARRCAAWVNSDAVAVRSVKQANFLHGKMYLTGGAGVVGSSNFTKNGLGGSVRPNLEINLAVSDAPQLAELQQWFDDLWKDDRLTYDVKQKVLDALNRLGRDYAPDFVYFKTLYELFKDEIDPELDSDRQLREQRLHGTAVWNKLYEFQKDGAKSVIARLQQHNGCILADSVGLGKTYTALAVIKYYELLNERVLVLCPKKLYENWALYPQYMSRASNPFLEDRFNYALRAHTDLSRDLPDFTWDSFSLVVIDESHNFRNTGNRYRKLLDDVIASGARTKVLMLSATPVNTALTDLRNQVYLMTEGREGDFLESLGVGNIGSVMASAQKEFKQWETEQRNKHGRRDKAQLLEKLGADFLRLLDGVSIARSRRHITRFYAEEMERIGQFPHHAPPVNEYPQTDLRGELSYEALAARINRFQLAVYRPSDYLIDAERQLELAEERGLRNFNQQDREHYLVAMMRVNFLKRLESSPHSLTLTLQRTIAKIDALLEKIERFESTLQDQGALDGDVTPDDDEEDDDFSVNRARRPYHLGELDLDRWQTDVRGDRETLAAALEDVRAVTPERDGKLQKAMQAVRERAAGPTMNMDGEPNRKMLVFTTFKDTAEYLYAHLEPVARELGINAAMVSGDETLTVVGANKYNEVLTNFAPRARNRDGGGPDVDLLIATDCISEGQNLQDCDTVLNYDIHWNPVRLIQRFGRIDRIGSRNSAVRMLNYWPTQDMDAYLRLENRVMARMALVDTAASGGDDPFNQEELEEGAQLELSFRDEQLKRLREEVPDLEDLADGVVMSDLTMDYFLAQLRQYLEKNKDELEATPPGVYAVAPAPAESPGPGVLFVLRQRNASNDRRQRNASPIHPFYLAYVLDDGSIRYGCGAARHVLDAFERAASGRTSSVTALCDWFDRETEHGKRMERYDALLTEATGQIRGAHAGTQTKGLSLDGDPGFVLPKASESPRGADDFELVTWLVVR